MQQPIVKTPLREEIANAQKPTAKAPSVRDGAFVAPPPSSPPAGSR